MKREPRMRGRQKTFDRKVALEAAMLLFWERGFEQTTIDDLAGAMGISTSSLYSTFGDKEALFLSALDLYQASRGRYTTTALEDPTSARNAFQRLFDLAAYELTRPKQPRGCMLALSMMTSSPGYKPLQRELKRRRAVSSQAFVSRLEEAVRKQELPGLIDIAALASFLMTTLMGMSLQARNGATKDDLLKVGAIALEAWPLSTRAS
jgi:AcrR family transcriptional regulator